MRRSPTERKVKKKKIKYDCSLAVWEVSGDFIFDINIPRCVRGNKADGGDGKMKMMGNWMFK